MTCKEIILDRLNKVSSSLAVHEFHLSEYSENNVATRLNELEREGKLKSRFRKGHNYKEWWIPQSGQLELFGDRAA